MYWRGCQRAVLEHGPSLEYQVTHITKAQNKCRHLHSYVIIVHGMISALLDHLACVLPVSSPAQASDADALDDESMVQPAAQAAQCTMCHSE